MCRAIVVFMFAFASLDATARDQSASPLIASVRAQAETTLDQLTASWTDHGGLELVTGGPSAERTQSRWGHVSLRFVGSAPVPLEDLTIEAMALNPANDHVLKLMAKGALGGYPIAPLAQSLGQLIRSYYFEETRGYARTIIPSTVDSRRALIDTLRAVNRDHTGRDRYYFFTTNCSSYVSWILERAGFKQLDPPVPFLPTHVSLHLRRSFVSPWPEIEGVSADRLKSIASDEKRPLAELSTLELQRLIVFRGFALGDRFFAATAELERRTDLRSTEEVYGVRTLPAAFYDADPAAVDGLDRARVREAFTPAAIGYARRFDRAAWRASHTSAFCRTAPVQCAYFDRVRGILNEVRRPDAPSKNLPN